jgi:hypothetical protein
VAVLDDTRNRELHAETTPDQMVRARPDLTTGELKMPLEE